VNCVLIVPGRLDTRTGGYGYDRRIVGGLRACGWSVEVRELDDGFPRPTASARRRAARVLADIPDDSIVLVDGLALGALPREVEPHATRLRLVALVHHPLALETGVDPAGAGELEASERRALASARHVVVTSRATAETLVAYEVTADRIGVVEPGTDHAPLARGSQSDRVEMLCVAALIPRKGHDVLLRALDGIDRRGWRLTCAGSRDRDRAFADRLQHLVREHRLEQLVVLAGEADDAAIAAQYDRADLFVLPALYEGYGMAVAEALARGLPVVSTATGAIPELVNDDAGRVVPPGDVRALRSALSDVLGDEGLRARLAEGARRVRDRLPTWDEASAKMAAVLEQVARG
jgi:glycosyltransferase involved in cell wall biosynthesis